MRTIGLHAITFLSGFTALGREIVWIRHFAAGLAQEAVSLLAVVAACFAGLGLGACAAARYVESSARPAA